MRIKRTYYKDGTEVTESQAGNLAINIGIMGGKITTVEDLGEVDEVKAVKIRHQVIKNSKEKKDKLRMEKEAKLDTISEGKDKDKKET